MTYEDRHAAMASLRRDAIERTRDWLLATYSAPALWQMMSDRVARPPLGGDPADARASASAIARESVG